ncbi:MAG: hypothetical protein ACN6I0_00365 [Peredibacter sp.]
MKKVLTLILSFQLMITGFPVFAATIEEQQAACTGADKSWNSELNRCMVTQEAIDMKDNADSCETSSDPESCYMKTAEERTGVNKGQRSEDAKGENIGKMVAGAYALYSLFATTSMGDKLTGATKKVSTGCLSKKIFQATSIAWVAGDYFLKHKAKKGFEELADKYKTETENEESKGAENSSYQSQVRAFYYLREEQQQVQQLGKNRSKLQMATAAGFAASLGFAIYELTPAGLAAGKRCVTTIGDDKPPGETTGGTTGETTGGTTGQTTSGSTTGDTTGKPTVDPAKTFSKQLVRLGSSAQIAVGAGIMLALNAYLIYHAKNEVKKAEQNVETIDDVIATYNEFMSGFCPDGREDINNDRCYCYNSDGTKNDNRTQSVICQNLFAADEMNFALKNEKLADITEGPRQGCVTITGQFDLDCKCTKMKNNVTGQNACSTAPNSALLTGGFGAKLGAANAVNTLGKFPNGANQALASLNSADLAKNAAHSDRLIGNLVKDANSKGINVKGPDELKGLAEKLALRTVTPKQLSSFNSAFNPSGKQFGAVPKGLDGALKKAQEKVDITGSTGLTVKAATGKVGAGNKKGAYKFNWNDAAAREGNKVQTFMEKDYDYKGSDIVKRDDVSLWNVISNRYQTSGLRRLFGEEEDE